MTFLVADGVVPSNEERGYVLRRIIRRAVRHAYRLGARTLVTPALVDATVATMGSGLPGARDRSTTSSRPSSAARRSGSATRSSAARTCSPTSSTRATSSGERAFFLHDTLGFPIDLTREIAAERGRDVDLDGFGARMEEQRARAREAHKAEGGAAAAPVELYRELLDEHGATEFTGRQEYVDRRRRGARAHR